MIIEKGYPNVDFPTVWILGNAQQILGLIDR
jgi:hypothetical protein